MGGWFLLHVVHSSCYLSSLIYKGLESTLFLFLPLTKLSHPNMLLLQRDIVVYSTIHTCIVALLPILFVLKNRAA